MAWVPRPPSEAEYRAVVEEFWWESLYVAKYVGRNELLPARYSLETVLRFGCLIPMLEWYVQLGRDWEQSIGVHGSGLRWLLEPEERTTLDRTYAGEKLKEHAEALGAMIELFTRAARAVARNRGFAYPLTVERETRALLERK
jgi:aminoglycoside 6-adenylyltransferase